MSSLSTRGASFKNTPEWLGPLVECIKEAGDGTDETKILNLGVATNVLCHDMMEAQITKLRRTLKTNRDNFNYFQFEGTPAFRTALSGFFNEFVVDEDSSIKTTPEDFMVANGVGPLLENLISCIADAGDCILVPAPMYHAFAMDLCTRLKCVIKPVPVTVLEDGTLSLDVDAIEAAYQDVLSGGKKAPVFLATNPHNPTGCIFPASELRKVAEWCVDKEVHFVSDEIYALSIFTTATTPFVSAFNFAHAQEMPGAETFVHVLWGFSKDFGLNGMRVGALLTRNPELKSAMQAIACFFAISADIQQLGAALLSDFDFVKELLAENRKRITHAYDEVVATLRANGVSEIVKSEAAMFVYFKWPKPVESKEDEKELWLSNAQEKRVMALPGYVFMDARRGWFRICITAYDLDITLKGITRLLQE